MSATVVHFPLLAYNSFLIYKENPAVTGWQYPSLGSIDLQL